MMKNMELASQNVQNKINEMIETFFNEKRFGKWSQERMDYECGWMLDFSIDVDHDDNGNDIYMPSASMVYLPSNTTVWSLDDSEALYMVGPDGGTYEEAMERIKEIVFDFCEGCERAVENWNERLKEECESMLTSRWADDNELLEERLENMVEYWINTNDVVHDSFAEVMMEDAKREYYDRKTAAAFEKAGI